MYLLKGKVEQFWNCAVGKVWDVWQFWNVELGFRLVDVWERKNYLFRSKAENAD